MRTSGIYCILNNVNQKVYIGSSINMHKRKISHFNTLRNNKHRNRKLQFSFNKYGEGAFEFEVVENVCVDKLIESEQKWIDFFKPEFNIIPFANRITFSEDHKKRLSESHIGNKHTDESKLKIGAASKGNKYRVGSKLSESHKRAISEATKKIVRKRGEDHHSYGKKRDPKIIEKTVRTKIANRKHKGYCHCGSEIKIRGLCPKHYKKLNRTENKNGIKNTI